MKRLALLCGAAGMYFAPLVSSGQEVRWNAAPHKGFVFQITNKEAERFLTRHSPDTLITRLLHTQVDTFDVRKGWHNRPEKGHFLLASIVANQLHCEYTSVFPYQVFLLKEYQSLALQVVDNDGTVRKDAVVRLRNRRIRLDTLSQTYRLANAWFNHDERFVTVELEGFRSVFNVTKHEVPDWDRGRNYGDGEGPDFYSYLVTDKNKYRPGERVRFKSFALTGQRFLLRKPLEVWMTGVIYKKVGAVDPHRPGSYAGEFYLHDSLNLDLDRTYNLQLREKRGRVVANCRFRYEDYELNGDRLEVRLSSAKQYYPAKNELTILATDANGLLQKGARASVVVRAGNIHETFEPVAALQDTLLRQNLELDMDKATVVEIPSELFAKVNASYEVLVTVHNSQNQTTAGSAAAEYVYAAHEVKARFSHDSIVYEYFRSGQPMHPAPFLLRTDDEEVPRKVILPYAEKINATTRTHFFQGDSVARQIQLRELVPKLEVTGGIHRDSLQLRLVNPQQLNVSWFVYQGPDLQRQGFGKKMKFDTLITDRSYTYYVEVLYAFGGEDHVLRKEFMFREDRLNVELAIPDRVYPGQQAEALIEVTDGLGFPVSGVDLTAIGVNGKLGYLLPNLPYYGFTSLPRSKKATFSKDDVRSKIVRTNLDYPKWARRAGLDTMMYYRFTYPGRNLFLHSVPIDDGTQFAPFVMQKGVAVRVHVVEVNHVPVYFDWTDQPKQYSFYVSSANCASVSLRLHDRVLVLDSIPFTPGHKTILSMDVDRLPASVKVITLPPNRRKRWEPVTWSLTRVEESRYASYVSTFRFRSGPVYIEQGRRFVPLFTSDDYSHRNISLGPVPEGEWTFSVPMERLFTSYEHEGGYDYKVSGNVVYKLTGYGLLPKTLRKTTFDPMTLVNDKAMTKEVFMANRSRVDAWHTRSVVLRDWGLEMKVLLPEERARSGFDNILFVHCENGTVISSCRRAVGQGKEHYQVPIGCYDVVALFNNGTYLRMNRVRIQRWSRMVVDLGSVDLHGPDSLSNRWSTLAARDCYPQVERREIRMRQPRSYRKGNVVGRVTSAEDGEGLPGVNVLVRGTTNGTVTDADGYYELYIQGEVTLDFSFIGFATESVQVGERSIVDVSMTADVKQLTEVVVTAQGFSRDTRALGYSVSEVLMGKMPGVTFTDSSPEATFPDEGDPEEQQAAEQALYAELLQLNAIRSRFSDVAF